MTTNPDSYPSTADEEGVDRWSPRQFVRKLLGIRSGHDNLRDTIEELIGQEGSAPQQENAERDLLRNALRFRDVTVEDVMVPHPDIVAVEVDASLLDVARVMSESGHSRLPVHGGQLDDVMGMVHIKDLFTSLWEKPETRIRNIVRDMLFVAPSMPVIDLLLEMRHKRVHMALVVDEFGGTDGLVTIEDLVEEIVGEIEDEHDEGEDRTPCIHRDGGFDVDARMEIEDFEKEASSFLTNEEREGDVHTMGGLVFYLAGRVPARKERIAHSSGWVFEILEADPRRIHRIHARAPATASSDTAE